MSVLARSLLAAWALFWSFVLLLTLFPKAAARIPHLELIRPYMVILVLVSVVYGIVWLYHQGVKRAKGK